MKIQFFNISPAILLLCVSMFGLMSASKAVAATEKKDSKPKATAAQGEVETTQEKFSCLAEISYEWQPAAEKSKPLRVDVASARAEGTSAEEAKRALEEEIISAKREALRECRDQHENKARCVSSRIKQLGDDYALLDFNSRATFLEAITADCSAISGTCLSAQSSEPQCAAPPTMAKAPEAEETKEKKKKGAH